jgi:hypothetical protein
MSRRARSKSRGICLRVEFLEDRRLLSTASKPSVAIVTGPAAADNQAYVDALVGPTTLGTPGISALRQTLTAELNSGVPRDRVVLNLLRSRPARVVQVETTYTQILGRAPSQRELNAGVATIGRAGDSRALAAALASSLEAYRVRGGRTASGYVQTIYNDFLGRHPSAGELAAGIRRLTRTSRSSFVRQVMSSPEAATFLAAGVEATFGAQGPGATPQDIQDLSRPGGLLKLQARVLSSDTAFESLVSPPPTSTAASASPPGFPSLPGFNLDSGVQTLVLPTNFVDYSLFSMSAGSDGVPWFGTHGSLQTLNVNTGQLSTSVTSESPVSSVSAINATEAYAVMSEAPTNVTGVYHVTKGAAVALPALPGGDSPSAVSATADGLVWVLGQSGAVYALASGGESWTTIPHGSYAIASISLGSAENVWALTTDGTALRYTTSTGFQPVDIQGAKVDALQATSDGSVWVVQDGFVFLMAPGTSTWTLAPQQPTGLGSTDMFAAGSRNAAFIEGPLTGQPTQGAIEMVTFGLLDRPKVPFPAYQGQEEAAYLQLSADAGYPGTGGIRAQYNDPAVSFSDYLTNIEMAARPPQIDVSAWTPVQAELESELKNVMVVYKLFNLIGSLDSNIQIVNTGALGGAEQLVGLSSPSGPDANDKIVAGLLGFFEELASDVLKAVGGAAGGPAGSVVGGLLGFALKEGLSSFSTANNVTNNNAVTITYSDLQGQLNTLFLDTLAANASAITSIVSDLGMLTDVANAVQSGFWPITNESGPQIATDTTDAYNAFALQSLTAVKWQVVYTRYGDYITYPFYQLEKLPAGDVITIPDGMELTIPIALEYFMNAKGGPVDLYNKNFGQLPVPALVSTLYAMGGNDFLTGQGNWSVVQHVQATD